MITNITPIFLLGGADLEMKTIEALLKRVGVEYKDKCSGWYDATLDKYNEDLKQYSDVTLYNIYGVELRGYTSNANYSLIDHHNENEFKPSSLEQVAKILNIELSEYEKYVAANDRGYIPEMQKMGASQDQINKIREADRKAQGVTAGDERKAEDSILNSKQIGNLKVIESFTDKFSAVRDRLEFKDGCKRILIYNDRQLTYYGKNRDSIKNTIYYADGVDCDTLYSGGGDNGFTGIGKGKTTKESIVKVVDQIISQVIL